MNFTEKSLISRNLNQYPKEYGCCSFVKGIPGDFYVYIPRNIHYNEDEIKKYLKLLNNIGLYNELITDNVMIITDQSNRSDKSFFELYNNNRINVFGKKLKLNHEIININGTSSADVNRMEDCTHFIPERLGNIWGLVGRLYNGDVCVHRMFSVKISSLFNENGVPLLDYCDSLYNNKSLDEIQAKLDIETNLQDKYFIVRIPIDKMLSSNHKLGTHTAIRYLYSKYYNRQDKSRSFVDILLKLRDSHPNWTDYDCMYIAHLLDPEEISWYEYHGLFSDYENDEFNYLSRKQQKNTFPNRFSNVSYVHGLMSNYITGRHRLINITKAKSILAEGDYDKLLTYLNECLDIETVNATCINPTSTLIKDKRYEITIFNLDDSKVMVTNEDFRTIKVNRNRFNC